MSLVRCRECRKEISTEAGACPHCGCPKPAPPPGERSGARSIAILITLVIGGAFMLPMCTSNKPVTSPAALALPAAPAPAPPPKPPPTAAETKAQTKVDQINAVDFCGALGRALRNPKANSTEYLDAMIARALNRESMTHEILGGIKDRRPVLGMDICAVIAALGRPERANRSVRKDMEHYQLVYADRRIYVYLDNGIVTSWQD